MKVVEKGTDRCAEVHIYVEGKLKGLAEYGEHIDAKDKAICCYVPLEDGHKVKIGGRFSGTTLDIAYNAVVDGIHRKASLYAAKTVHNQKNKKLDIEGFLYSTNKGIVETEIHVVPLSGMTAMRGEGRETIGTIELRLYVTRQLGVSHALGNIQDYFNEQGNVEDEVPERAIYRRIEPTLRMEFEENCAPLDKSKANREQRRMGARRPGTEPWAIFRFHYRSEEAILVHDLEQTYDPTSKAKTEPYTLDLEPVPPLPEGTKPFRDDGDSSTRASSSVPPDTTPAPVKRARKEPASKPPAINSAPMSETHKDDTEALRQRVFSKVNADTMKSSSKADSKSTDDGANKSTTATESAEKPANKPVESEQAASSDTIAMVVADGKPTTSTTDSAVKASSLPEAKLKPTNGTTTKSASLGAQIVNKDPKDAILQRSNRPGGKPAPIGNATQSTPKQPETTVNTSSPIKRAAETTDSITLENKRQKSNNTPPPHLSPTTVARKFLSTPPPRPAALELKVAEQRKKLQATQQKRLETAKKQEALDKKMEPHKQRLAEELERLNREVAEEEAAAAEDEERYHASMEILKEFEREE